MGEERQLSQKLFDNIDRYTDGRGRTVVVLVRDPRTRSIVLDQLDGLNCRAIPVDGQSQALETLRTSGADLVLSELEAWHTDECRADEQVSEPVATDKGASGSEGGLESLFEEVARLSDEPYVVLIGARREAKRAARAGAVDYLPVPVEPLEVVETVSRTLRGEGRFQGAALDALESIGGAPEPPSSVDESAIDFSLVDAALSDEEIAALDEPFDLPEIEPILESEILAQDDSDSAGSPPSEDDQIAEAKRVLLDAKLASHARWWCFFFEVRRLLRSENDVEARITQLIDCFRSCVNPAAVGTIEFADGGPRIQSGSQRIEMSGGMDEDQGRAWAAIVVACLTGVRDAQVLRLPIDKSSDAPEGASASDSRQRSFVAYFAESSDLPSPDFLDELTVVIGECFIA